MVVIQQKFEPDRKKFSSEQTFKIKVPSTVVFPAWLWVCVFLLVPLEGSYVVVYKY